MGVHLFVSDMLTACVLRSFSHGCTFVCVGHADGIRVEELLPCVYICLCRTC